MSVGVEVDRVCVCRGGRNISDRADASAVAKLSTIRKVITAITLQSNQLAVFLAVIFFLPLPAG